MRLSQEDWSRISRDPRFVELHRRKTSFLFGWWGFSTVYYLLLPIVAGGAPGLFSWKIIGDMNLGCLFVLSQFLVSWAIALHYVSWSKRVSDKMTSDLLENVNTGGQKA